MSYPHLFLLYLPLLILVFYKTFALGLLLGAGIQLRFPLPQKHWSLLLLCSVGSIGYLHFWVYYNYLSAGLVLSYIGTGLCIVGPILVWLTPRVRRLQYLVPMRESLAKFLRDPDIQWPLVLLLTIALFYLSFLFTVSFARGLPSEGQLDFVNLRLSGRAEAPDYRVQYMIIEKLFAGEPIWKRVLGQIQQTTITDRPPLLAGMSLAALWLKVGLFSQYYLTCLIGQLTWILAGWAALRTAGLSRTRSAFWLLFFAQLGFFFFHSIYAWPKLASGAFVLSAYLILAQSRFVNGQVRPLENREIILAASLAALGTLCHGSVTPVLIPIALLLLMPRWRLPWKQCLLGCLVFLTITMPWSVLKSARDRGVPHATRLLLADQYDEKTNRDVHISDWEAITRAYDSISWEGYLLQKWGQFEGIWNYRMVLPDRTGWKWLTGPYELVADGKTDLAKEALRNIDRSNLLGIYGLLQLAVPYFLLLAWRRWRNGAKMPQSTPLIVQYFTIAMVTGLITWLVAFNFALVTSMMSYTCLLMLFLALALVLDSARSGWLQLLFLVNSAYFSWVWLFGTDAGDQRWYLPYATLFFILWLAINLAAIGLVRRKSISHVTA